MASDTLQSEPAPATSQLATELEALHERVRRMEALLRGAESIVCAATKDGLLGWTPKDVENQGLEHRRGMEMIEFLGEQLAIWREAEAPLDFPSDDLWELWKRAKDGRLIRYGKSIPEPTE